MTTKVCDNFQHFVRTIFAQDLGALVAQWSEHSPFTSEVAGPIPSENVLNVTRTQWVSQHSQRVFSPFLYHRLQIFRLVNDPYSLFYRIQSLVHPTWFHLPLPPPPPSLPPTRNSCLHTVYILLTLFTEASTKKKAKRKPVYTEAVKQLLINQASPILTLHLKRFHQVGYSLRKIAKHVDFPLVLNLAPFCHKSCKVSRAAAEIYNR